MGKMKIRIFWMVALLLLSLAIIYLLHITHQSSVNKADNGFKRRVLDKAFYQAATAQGDFDHTSIFYATDSTVFIQEDKSKAIFILDTNFKKLETIDLMQLAPVVENAPTSLNVDGHFLYCLLPNGRKMIRVNVLSKEVQTVKIPYNFTRGVNFSGFRYILRGFDSLRTNQVFKSVDSVRMLTTSRTITENNFDGGLSTDGLLYKYDNNSFIYLYFFKNKVFHIDSGLQVLSSFNTIDTNTTCKNRIRKVASSNTFFFIGVPSIVNSQVTASNNFVYVLSKLKADNQSARDYYNSSSIDIYKLGTGAYAGSLEVPNDRGEAVQSIYVNKDHLYVMFPEAVKRYKILLSNI